MGTKDEFLATSRLGAVGVVVIGYNGGERFQRCIASVQAQTDHIVYVDSGSTDDSVSWSRTQGVEVVEWATDRFSAGQARNLGFQRLRHLVPDLQYVQFLDNDCIIAPVWLETARTALDQAPRQAIVCGRIREEKAALSLYNRLSQMAFAKLVGQIEYSEGVCMVRACAFAAVDGYNANLQAGEEIDLCHRLWERGWPTYQLAAPMVDHDAELSSFGRWWERQVRRGHGFARAAPLSQAAAIHRFKRRSLLWTGGPLLAVLGTLASFATGPDNRMGWTMLAALSAIWLVRIGRLAGLKRRQGWPLGTALAYGLLAPVEDWALLQGLIRYGRRTFTCRPG